MRAATHVRHSGPARTRFVASSSPGFGYITYFVQAFEEDSKKCIGAMVFAFMGYVNARAPAMSNCRGNREHRPLPKAINVSGQSPFFEARQRKLRFVHRVDDDSQDVSST